MLGDHILLLAVCWAVAKPRQRRVYRTLKLRLHYLIENSVAVRAEQKDIPAVLRRVLSCDDVTRIQAARLTLDRRKPCAAPFAARGVFVGPRFLTHGALRPNEYCAQLLRL